MASPFFVKGSVKTMAYPKSVLEMKNELGDLYEIKNIDLECCLYRNLRNGFDVEISGVYSRKQKKNRKITIWLWWIGSRQNKTNIDAQVITHVSQIPYDAEAVHTVTEMLYAYSNKLLAEGRNVNDRININLDRLTYNDFISQGQNHS